MLNDQHILKRAGIKKELTKIFNYPLTVAVAPMGYGKTTAARDFLKEVNARYIWVYMENDETSPQYIWESLTRQLVKLNFEIGCKLNEMGFPAGTPQKNRTLKLIEDYAYNSNSILVIDDYHFVHSREMDEFIELLVKSSIKGLHILILSRTKPEFNIEELMLKGYCYRLQSDLFELSQVEVKEFFELCGCNVPVHMIRQVYEISEGWISAVYLLMQRYMEDGILEPGDNLEGLIEKGIMSRYTDSEARTLISLSILDSFTPNQAVYVTGDREAENIIHMLSRDNSFIRYDEQNGFYKIHNIFNNYLKNKLERDYSGAERDQLYKRSGEWHIKNGDIPAGLKHLLKAGEYDLILTEFEKKSITKVIDNNSRFILELFEHIPGEIKYRYPIGYINYASFYVTNVDREGGRHILSAIEHYYLNDTSTSPAMKRRVAGELELIKCYLAFNDLRKMHERLYMAFKLLDGHSVVANEYKIATYGSPQILYMYYREKGKMLWAVEYLEAVFPYFEKLSSGCGAGFELQARAEYCLETGDFEGAGFYAYKAMYKARTRAQVDIIICANLVLARLSAARGKFDEAIEIMDNLSAEVERCNSPILSSAYELCAGYTGSIIGEEKSFAGWLQSGNIEHSEILYQGLGLNYIVHARSLLLEKNYIKLEFVCEEMMKIFSRFNNLLGFLHGYILRAAAQYNLYGMDEARDAMKSALEIGRADNIVVPFAEYSNHVLDILKNLQQDAANDSYLKKIVEHTANYCARLGRLKDAAPVIFSLANREKEILQLIVEGKTNREIASELFIAEVTVKKNVTSIYRKLKVTGRAAAVRKAIELEIT